MPTITAEAALSPASHDEAVRPRRLPRAVGLGVAALISLGLWCGAFMAIGYLI
jgi:hypothetical protein